jgi:putative ABC transport system substrate-binding protein
LLFGFREELCRLSLGQKLPSIGQWPEMATAGCLVGYGPTHREVTAMRAALVDKMLKGARPGETPAQQPTRFELAVNLKTAKELGLAVPPSILGRADEVIE